MDSAEILEYSNIIINVEKNEQKILFLFLQSRIDLVILYLHRFVFKENKEHII